MGAGRSELARAIFGFDRRLAGAVIVDGSRVPPTTARRRDRRRHRLRPRGPQARGAAARCASILDNATLCVPERISPLRASFDRRKAHWRRRRRSPTRCRSSTPSLDQLGLEAVRRQPAEGGAGALAGAAAEAAHPRRADARHRHRRQGRDLPADRRARGRRHRRHPDLVGDARADRPRRPRPGHGGRPHHRRARRARRRRGSDPARSPCRERPSAA